MRRANSDPEVALLINLDNMKKVYLSSGSNNKEYEYLVASIAYHISIVSEHILEVLLRHCSKHENERVTKELIVKSIGELGIEEIHRPNHTKRRNWLSSITSICSTSFTDVGDLLMKILNIDSDTPLAKLHNLYPKAIFYSPVSFIKVLNINCHWIELVDPFLLHEMKHEVFQRLYDDANDKETFLISLREQFERDRENYYANMKKDIHDLVVSSERNDYWKNLDYKKNFLSNEQMLLDTLSFLDPRSLLRVKSTCKEWFRLIVCTEGASHKPLVTELFFHSPDSTKQVAKRLLSYFGHNLKTLKCTYFDYEDYYHIYKFCTKLNTLGFDSEDIKDGMIELIALGNPGIQYLYLKDVCEVSPVSFFKNCRDLVEVHYSVKPDEVFDDFYYNEDSGILNDEILKKLADNTNGHLERIEFTNCTPKVTDAGMAYLVSKCPKLMHFKFRYRETEQNPRYPVETMQVLINIVEQRNNIRFISIEVEHVSLFDHKLQLCL
jgi:hypothetical protein